MSVEAAEGDLDATFSGGKVITDFFGEDDVARDVVIQPLDGKILVVGSSTNSSFDTLAGIARYNPDGTPDLTFGIGGKVTSDFFNYLYTVHCAIQPNDGKIVVVGAGIGAGGSVDWAVARFMPNGDPDPTFGVGGGVKSDFFGGIDVATSVDFQSDGKIVVVGGNTKNGQSDWAVMRFDSGGTPDPAFGVGGKVTLDFFGMNEVAYDVAIQPGDGKVIVAGTSFVGVGDSDIALARYDSSGNPDPSFGVGGKVTTNIDGQDYADTMELQSDGKIVVAGQNDGGLSSADFALVRYDTNGTPDPGFGVGGIVVTDFFGQVDAATDLVIQPNGKIVAVGAAYQIGQPGTDFGLARYETNGTPDGTFGIGGLVVTNFTNTDIAEAVAIQPDCKIVAVGYTAPENTTNADFAIARYDGGGCAEPPAQDPCPKPQGYWKNNPSLWPVDSLILGTQSYTKAQLLAILNNSTQSDASIILAKQLIAAKLNVENGADPTPAAATISHGDILLSSYNGKLPYRVKSSSTAGRAMVKDGGLLDKYNNALLTPACSP